MATTKKPKQTQVRFPPGVWDRVLAEAEAAGGRSANSLVVEFVQDGLERIDAARKIRPATKK